MRFHLTTSTRCSHSVSTLALAAALMAGTIAQTAVAQTTPAPAAEDTGGITDIIVTAQRREENLQVVPVSVTAFSAEQLKQQGITDIGRLENLVPGFTFGRSGVDGRPALRGVRTENVGVNGDTTIGFYLDGVYQSRAAQVTASFVDIARVEVQRGPQGTLYGRNTFGGNIVVQTQEPLSELGGYGNLIYGQNQRFRAEAAVNVPLGDTVAVRVAGAYETSKGFVKNDNPLGNNLFDDDLKYVRGSILFKPADDLKIVIKADYTNIGGAGGSAFGYKLGGTYYYLPTQAQLYNATPFTTINTRGGNRDGVVDAPFTTDIGVPIYQPNDPYRIDTDQKTLLDLTNTGIAANISYDFGPVTLKSITGFTDFSATRTSDTDFSGNAVGVDYQKTSSKVFSQELQLLSGGTGPLEYVLGAFYFHDKLRGVFINQQTPRIIRNVKPNLTLPQNGAGFYDEQRAQTESIAAYAQVSYKFTDQLKLTVGGRYTRDKKDFAFANAASVLPLAGTPLVPVGTTITLATGGIPDSAFGAKGAPTNCTYTSFPPPRAGFQCLAANTTVLTGATYDTKEFKKFTGRIGLDYQLTDDNLLYASVSTGFRSGGFNSGQNTAALTPTFAPEKITAFEIGSKNRFMDDTVQLNISAYYNKLTNLQEQRQVAVGATTLSIIENSGKARSYGVEVEGIWKPVSDFTISATLAYLNAKYTEYRNVPAPFGTSILIPNAANLTPTIVDGVTIAPAGQQRIFAVGYNCGLVPGTGGVGQAAATYGCDISGNKIPHSPELSGSISAQYDFDLGSAGVVTPFAVVTYSSSYFGQPFNSVLEKQNAYAKVDLRLTWTYDERYSIQGFVNNVTDKATATRFVWGGGGAVQKSFAPPRLWGVRVSAKF